MLFSALEVNFFLKDHKDNLQLRVVGNEKGTWQHVVPCFIQGCLKQICLSGSLMLKNSDELVEKLRPFHETKCFLQLLNIKDLYYLLNHNLSLNRLKLTLEFNLVRFQLGAGIAIDDFFGLLSCI